MTSPTLCISALVGLVVGSLAAEPGVDWAADAVWYQIFPERFCNGDPTNDPTRETLEWPITPSEKWRIAPWTGDWYARDEWEQEIGPDFYADGLAHRRYGGDLQGVLDRLDYLADLGVTALYFNPLFHARSLHKYDGTSFHHIDPHFGPDPRGDRAQIEKEMGDDPKTWTWTAADRLFLRLLAEARRRGLRVILDGVFNHTGRACFAFQDVLRNQQRSRFRGWYAITTFDDPQTRRLEFDYEGWWGFKTLPIFAASADGLDLAPGPKAYVFAATRRWMDPDGDGDPADGIDGWRLDVASERPAKLWAEWNAHVRALNPRAYTSAEIWTDAAWLIADGGFSAAMNYHAFAIPVKGFLIDARIGATEFARLLDERRAALPARAVPLMQNLLGSHDTDRVASMIVNAGRSAYADADKFDYNVNADPRSAPEYRIRRPDERERAIQRLVVLFQMTCLGAPMIYYGDEAGLWGANDPDNRMPMVWPEMTFAPQAGDPRGGTRTPDAVRFERAVFDFYRAAIAFRKKSTALRRGDFRVIGAFDEAQVFAFERRGAGEWLLVVLNRSERAQVVRLALPADFATAKAVFSTNADARIVGTKYLDGALTLTLPPLTGAVLDP